MAERSILIVAAMGRDVVRTICRADKRSFATTASAGSPGPVAALAA